MTLPHYGQIMTNRKTILEFINDIEMPIVDNTIYLLTYGLNLQDDYLKLYSVCARLYYLSRLVYMGKEGIRKLDKDIYQKELFDGRAENAEEVLNVMTLQRRREDSVFDEADATMIFNKLERLRMLWCHSISCLWEQIYIPELAYAFEYVLRHDDCPIPEFNTESSLFPDNYDDYNYTEGVAAYFEEIMDCLF